jgi:CRP/FNR family transcriptional regulator
MTKGTLKLYRLFTQGQKLTFNKNELILSDLIEADGVYFIEKGVIKVYSINKNGDEYINVLWGSGDIFPFTWGYLGRSTRLFYEALDEVSAWRINRSKFLKFIYTDIKLSNIMAKQMARQYSVLVNRIDNLEYKTASDRVAYCLLYLAERFGSISDDGVFINAPLTHDTLASSLKLARESFSRELEKLASENIVERRGRSIVIKEVDRLKGKISEPYESESLVF